jgi:hypothetical protein
MRWPSSWLLVVFAMRHASHGAVTPLNPTPERLPVNGPVWLFVDDMALDYNCAPSSRKNSRVTAFAQ